MSFPSVPRWLDGRWLGEHEALPASDLPGVFETLRCERGVLGFARAHLERMEQGARTLALAWPPPWDPGATLASLARALGPACAALRIRWTPPHLALVARPLALPPAECVALLAAPGCVAPPLPFGVKTTRRRAYDELRAEGLSQGAFEVLVRSGDGALVEGTVTNLFVAADGELSTPPTSSGALPGIVRAVLLSAAPLRDARGRVWRVCERPVSASDLSRAEEVLLTNSLLRVVGLTRLEGQGAGRNDLPGAQGPLARALLARIQELEAALGFPV